MKQLAIIVSILTIILVGCSQDEQRISQLEQRVSELETQLETQSEQYANQRSKSDAIVQFAERALELQDSLVDIQWDWIRWYSERGTPIFAPDAEAHKLANELGYDTFVIIKEIEELYAPPEALESKYALLNQGDMLDEAFRNLGTYTFNLKPLPEFLNKAEELLDSLDEVNRNVRRSLIDLKLEYQN